MKGIVSKNPLFFSFIFPALTDGIVTLIGQDNLYWTGRVVNEASPIYYILLVSPWLYVLGAFSWFVFWYLLFTKLKEPINIFMMFAFIAGHSWGSSTWLWKFMKDNHIYSPLNQPSVIFAWSINILYFFLIAFFATYCMMLYLKPRNDTKLEK